MSNDDHTVDADEATLEELKRLAADARRSPAESDSTVQADDTTMDELRRFAAEARRSAAGSVPAASGMQTDTIDRTVDADETTMDALRQYAAEASSGGNGIPALDVPDTPMAPPIGEPAHPVALPDLPEPIRPRALPAPEPGHVDHTQARSSQPPDEFPAPPSMSTAGWQPPPRMVMPTEPEKREVVHHGPWKRIALALAAVVIVLLVLVVSGVVGGGDGGDVPSDDSVPSSLEGGDLEPGDQPDG